MLATWIGTVFLILALSLQGCGFSQIRPGARPNNHQTITPSGPLDFPGNYLAIVRLRLFRFFQMQRIHGCNGNRIRHYPLFLGLLVPANSLRPM